MNSPFMGNFRVSQEYKGANHKGLDLVPLESKEVHAVTNGTVIRAGWENPNDPSQGWGLRVVIKQDNLDRYFYYGHLSDIKVCKGQKVKITDIIGICGNTGCSTGEHLHIECRLCDSRTIFRDISKILKIPNKKGTYNDGYVENVKKCPYCGQEMR